MKYAPHDHMMTADPSSDKWFEKRLLSYVSVMPEIL